ncbi:MAG TPA: NAD-dependent epimerase/dehydratase family protein [Vicinamibacterales bacterium]|nr:NAD-dependent epimerase/dehydratase family protein [Vicinamibacterales bacterium]
MGRRPGAVEDMVTAGMAHLLARDLDEVVDRGGDLWTDLRGARIFITGGTGFVGCWLLETLLWANDRLRLGAAATVLTRAPDAFSAKAPHLASHDAVTLLRGDVREIPLRSESFSHVVHAATDARPPKSAAERRAAFDTIVSGTRAALEFSRAAGAHRFLLTSSGAVYGMQPPEMTHVSEEYRGGPDPADSNAFYGEGKRASEMLCALYADEGFAPTIARCFAFVGPYLPLDLHFAVGNFIRDALAGGPIRVNGDGTPYRSYLYASDLALWLWTILLRGTPLRPYNVGSAAALTIEQLAHAVADVLGTGTAVEIARTKTTGVRPARYVPDVGRAERELGLGSAIPLAEAIGRTARWQTGMAAHAVHQRTGK